VQRAFDSYARYWVEAFRLPKLTPSDLDEAMSYEGYDHIQEALDEGNGAILVIPHLGCWDYAGRVGRDPGHPHHGDRRAD